MTICSYTVGFRAFREPRILQPSAQEQIDKQKRKYERSGLTEGAAAELAKSLMSALRDDKVFLDNDLKLPALAEKLNTTTHHLSQVINDELETSFAKLLRDFRVVAAQEMMDDPEHSETPAIQIAYAVGFNNKTSFSNAFKESTGFTPSEYRKVMKTIPQD
jgi:transcriptional regulator GlxA family with amidase domain